MSAVHIYPRGKNLEIHRFGLKTTTSTGEAHRGGTALTDGRGVGQFRRLHLGKLFCQVAG